MTSPSPSDDIRSGPVEPAGPPADPRPDDGNDDRTLLDQAAQSVRLTVPVAMAYVPLGIAFGVLMVTSGINWYWAPLSALLIFAGSIEFLGVNLIVSGTSLLQVALTALVVNFRHAFYGLTF